MRVLPETFIIVSLELSLALPAWAEHENGGNHPQAPQASNPQPAGDFLTSVFPGDPAVPRLYEQKIMEALLKEDDSLAANYLINLVSSLPDESLIGLISKAEAELSRPEVRNHYRKSNFVKAMQWTAEELLKEPRGKSAWENSFKDIVSVHSKLLQIADRNLMTLLNAAASGDQGAKEEIKRKYNLNRLLDEVRSGNPLRAKILEALGWKDSDGNLNLDMETDGGTPQTWQLGSNPAAALLNFEILDKAAVSPKHVLNSPAKPWERKFVHVEPTSGNPEEFQPRQTFSEEEEVCRKPRAITSKSVATNERPMYFFRPFASSDRAAYAGANTNHIIDLVTKNEIDVPGSYDGVPTPDEVFLTVPRDGQKITGLTFYLMDDLLAKQTPRNYVDNDMTGVYQSVGILKTSSSGERTYRVILASGSTGTLQMRDYVSRQDPMNPGIDIKPQGAVKALCQNLKQKADPSKVKTLALPMLSKDGQQIAALDVEEMTTKIYDLDEHGNCAVSLNLGIYTGKVDFDFNSSKITFHKYNNEEHATGWVDYPSDDLVANVYVYDRATNQMTKLTTNTRSNSLYPAFRKDGKVAYIDHPQGANDNSNEPSRLTVADPNTGTSVPFNFLKGGTPESEKRLSTRLTLGDLWSRLCSPYGAKASGESALLSTLGLGPAVCRMMVNRYGDNYLSSLSVNRRLADLRTPVTEESLKKVTTTDLLEECGDVPPQEPKPPTPAQKRSVEDIFTACRACHGSSAPAIRFEKDSLKNTMASKRNWRTLAEDILFRVREKAPPQGSRMPPGRPLTEEEISSLEQFLR